jgi:hypothetical protein
MIRDLALGLAAVVAAIFSIGGALALAQAQQPPGTGLAPATPAARFEKGSQKSGGSSAYGPANGFPGAAAPRGMVGMPMSTGSGMRMAGMVDDDPEMNELAQAEAALASESADILARYAEAENAAERKPIAAELREALAKQFAVQRQRRELELGRVEERVRKLREQIKKRDDARETIIDRRLDQLINDAEGLGWTPPAGGRGGTKSSGAGTGNFGSGKSSNIPRQ